MTSFFGRGGGCHVFFSVHYSIVVICWERANLLVLLYVMYSCPMLCTGSGVVFDCIDS